MRKFKALFGELTIRWTRTRYSTSIDDFKQRTLYELIASDNDSLVVRVPKPSFLGEGSELQQIHFYSDDLYWFPVNTSNGFVEWFRRVE